MQKPLLVTDFLDRAREYYGDHEAVVATTGDRDTYDELGERADRFAAALRARGVGKGDRVAVSDPNTHYHLEAAYGIMQLGAVHTPLNYRLTADDFEYILTDAGVDAIPADGEYAGRIETVRDAVPTETFVTNDPEAVDGDREGFGAVLDGAGGRLRPPRDERGRRDHPQLHVGDDGRSGGRDADPPDGDAPRLPRDGPPEHRGRRRLPLDAPDVPRRRLGSHLRDHGHEGETRLHARHRRRVDLRHRRRGGRLLPLCRAHGVEHAHRPLRERGRDHGGRQRRAHRHRGVGPVGGDDPDG